MPTYDVIASRGTPAELHEQTVSEPASPIVRVQEPTISALVLGSNQTDSVVDRAACRRAGVDVVRRRSGGGAVLVVPGDMTWLDVIVPRGAPGWDDDVHRPMIWLGHHLRDVFQARLAATGFGGRLNVHERRFRPGRWSDVFCFDGLGAGEVTLGGHKLVGISQRRTRGAARLQCSWYSSFDWQDALDLVASSHRPPADELAPLATIPTRIADAGIAEELARRLSTGAG